MADTPTPTPTPTTPAAPVKMTVAQAVEALKQLDLTAAQKKIDDIRAFFLKYAGKVGCNPYFYLTKSVDPLEGQLKGLSKMVFSNPVEQYQFTKDLVDSINALEASESKAVHDPVAKKQEEDRLAAKATQRPSPVTISPQTPGIGQ